MWLIWAEAEAVEMGRRMALAALTVYLVEALPKCTGELLIKGKNKKGDTNKLKTNLNTNSS